jgi:hypothetical protein
MEMLTLSIEQWERTTHLDYRRILLTALDELIVRELGILVPVHVLEDLVHPLPRQCVLFGIRSRAVLAGQANLFRGVLIRWELDHLPSHLIDGSYNLEHLLIGDKAVTVDVVELESPCSR